MPGFRTSRAFRSRAGNYYIDPLTGMVKPLPSVQEQPQQQEQQPQGLESLYTQGFTGTRQGFQLPGDQEEAVEQATSPLEQLYNQGDILNPALAGSDRIIPTEPLEPEKALTSFGPTTRRTREGMTTEARPRGLDYGFSGTTPGFKMPTSQAEILNPDVGRPTMRGERTLTEGTPRRRGGGGGAINTGRPAPRQGPRGAPRRARETRASLFKRYEKANAAGLLALQHRPVSNLLGYPGGRRRNSLLGG